MRINPLCVRACATRDAQLPLPGLPAFQWCSFRVRLYCPGRRRRDHGYTGGVLSSRRQRKSGNSQLLLPLWHSSIYAWRNCARIHVHSLPHVGQSIRVQADAPASPRRKASPRQALNPWNRQKDLQPSLRFACRTAVARPPLPNASALSAKTMPKASGATML
jgi:hypothetical protein